MFRKNLSAPVDTEVGTPMPSGATPGLTSSVIASTPMTPGMTPAMTPTLVPAMCSVMTPGMTPSTMTPSYTDVVIGGGVSRDQPGMFSVPTTVEQEPPQDDGEAEPEDESEKDLIDRYASKNLFTPSNALSAVGAKYLAWAESTSALPPSPVDTPATSASASASTAASKTADPVSEMAMFQSKYGATRPVIHNVVATANLGCELNLKTIAMTARNAEYNPRRFSAVIMRIREPKSTALVFKSGKLVVTGTKSQEEARHAARKFGRVIIKVGYSEARFKDFRIENLVATFTVPFPIHLEELYKSLPPNMHSQYEPEVFPGLICRVPDKSSPGGTAFHGTLLIFVSGKCVMIGMKTKENIEEAYKYILPRLEQYRKK